MYLVGVVDLRSPKDLHPGRRKVDLIDPAGGLNCRPDLRLLCPTQTGKPFPFRRGRITRRLSDMIDAAALARVAALQYRVAGLEGQVIGLQGKVDALQHEVGKEQRYAEACRKAASRCRDRSDVLADISIDVGGMRSQSIRVVAAANAAMAVRAEVRSCGLTYDSAAGELQQIGTKHGRKADEKRQQLKKAEAELQRAEEELRQAKAELQRAAAAVGG